MVAKIVAVFNQKGGAGKSTTSVQLGGTLGRRGYRVLLVDADKQRTTMRWVQANRSEQGFPADVKSFDEVGTLLSGIQDAYEQYDLIIVDCPPAIESPVPSAVLLIADLGLIPVKPSPPDVWSTVGTKQLIAEARGQNKGLQIAVLPVMVQKNIGIVSELLSVVSGDSTYPVTRGQLGLRSAFCDAALMGGTVHDVPRAKAAVAEVEELTSEVLAMFQMPNEKGAK